MSTTHSVEDVVEALRNAQRAGTKCSLLIGAGCSVDAGIPVASGIVREIEKDYPRSYNRANPRTYPNCLAQLAHGERRRLIAKYVDEARVNWAHVGIAALIEHGYVDRVLTTNFDPLVMRACAMVGVFPAVYDFAASQHFKPADVADRAVFHLHGQRSGFVLLNTEKEVAEHKESLRPVFRDAGEGRLWIVVGYSGENDPVFDLLAEQPRFDFRLYWVGFRDAPAPRHVQERLLGAEKHAFFVPGHTADSFFVELTRGLEIFPPRLIARPFTHVSRVIDTLTPFIVSGSDSGPDVLESARRRIQQAIESFEGEESEGAGAVARATELLMEGKYDEVLELRASAGEPSAELDDLAAWAMVRSGNALADLADRTSGPDAERLYREAGEKYQAAIEIKPDRHEALYNWGIALADLARLTTGLNAERLFREAAEKYQAAIEIEPDDHEALHNWGIALADLARLTSGLDAERLFREAAEKFQAALEIEPDDHEALYNSGVALTNLARLTTGPDAERVFREAAEKFQAALEIKPDKHEALNNWGSAITHLARLTTGADAECLFREAVEKYQAALEIKPDKHEALNNWGTALADLARRTTGPHAERLLREACEKFEAAIEIKPDKHEALYNWGIALADLADLATGSDAERLFREAAEKYRAALAIKPDKHEVLYHWGSALADLARLTTGPDAECLLREAAEKYQASLEIAPDQHDTLVNFGSALLWLISLDHLSGDAKQECLAEAERHLKKAEEISPGSGAYNLACVAARRGEEDQVREWLARSRAAGTLPDLAHLLADRDLDPVRETDWFRDLLSEIRAEETSVSDPASDGGG